MNFEQITTETVDRVLTITLNRPDRLDAWTPTMGRELIEAFDRADADDEVRAIIVTGAGRGFSAGADLVGGGETFDRRGQETDSGVHRDGGGRFTLRVFESTKPVIAAINGPAVGVGATMTLPMDIRVAADTARLGFVFTRRGIVSEAARAGSCRAWSASAERWNGWPPGACSPRRRASPRADSRGMFYRGQSADAVEGVTSFLEKRRTFPIA